MQRRHLPRAFALLVTGTTAGCSAVGEGERATSTDGSEAANTETVANAQATNAETADVGTAAPTASTETPSAPDVYVSEALVNLEGSDDETLDEEYVLVEVSAKGEVDLSGYTLAYGEEYRYSLPDVVDAVAPDGSVEVVSGEGTDDVDGSPNPMYTLFVGSDEPLLDNDGMRLTLRDAEGAVIDRTDYWAMDEGSLYVRPET